MTRTAAPKASDRPAGEIHGDAIYKSTELARRLGWGVKGYRQAKRAGLRTVKFGRAEFVLGRDVLDFFGRLANGGRDA